MSIILVGLNHRTAPIELREQFSLAQCALQLALEELRNYITSDTPKDNGSQKIGGISQIDSIILSTCHRVEVYADVENAENGQKKL